MTESVMINTNASSENIAINGDKNKRQVSSVHLAEDFRKSSWNFRKKKWAEETQDELNVSMNSKSSLQLFWNYHINHLTQYSCKFFFMRKKISKIKKTNKRVWFCFRDFLIRLFITFFVEHVSCCFTSLYRTKIVKQFFISFYMVIWKTTF